MEEVDRIVVDNEEEEEEEEAKDSTHLIMSVWNKNDSLG